MNDTNIPPGFGPNQRRSPLTDPWEPLYWKQTADAVIFGLRLAEPHTNARGLIHGGLIAALADKAMGHSCGHKLGGTVSLSQSTCRSITSAAPKSDSGCRSTAKC